MTASGHWVGSWRGWGPGEHSAVIYPSFSDFHLSGVGLTTQTSYSRYYLCLFPSLTMNSLTHSASLPISILF